MRIYALDDLAVQLHHEAQHAVRGRVLRAEIDRVVLRGEIAGGILAVLPRAVLAGHERAGIVDTDADGAGAHFLISSALSGVCAPGACGAFAFSSPGSTYWAPSQGLRKSKLRMSCASFTGE